MAVKVALMLKFSTSAHSGGVKLPYNVYQLYRSSLPNVCIVLCSKLLSNSQEIKKNSRVQPSKIFPCECLEADARFTGVLTVNPGIWSVSFQNQQKDTLKINRSEETPRTNSSTNRIPFSKGNAKNVRQFIRLSHLHHTQTHTMEISDTELRERLLACGYVAPPITGTSKAILVKKLRSLETNTPFATASASAADEEANTESSPDAPTIRQRPTRIDFRPQNVGTYSRCAARTGDFWDRVGLLGTVLLLLLATGAVFFVFKFIGDWSDRRYRSVHLGDGVFPKCSQGGQPRVTCVPDAEFAFVESNLNVVRAALHHATLAQHCSGRSGRREAADFIGMYPLFRDDRVRALLATELGFQPTECDTLLQNAKVLFKANPRLEVKVLGDGLLYRNQRLLRSCGFTAWNTVAYTYALYGLTSFAVVWFVYKFNRWVGKLRSDGEEQRRRLIKDIVDVLRQYEAQVGQRFLPVEEVRRWMDEAIAISDKLWTDVEVHLKEHKDESGLRVERKLVQGQERVVFCLQN